MGIFIIFILVCVVVYYIIKAICDAIYKDLSEAVAKNLGFGHLHTVSYYDDYVTVKSRQTLEKYDDIKYFKEDKDKLSHAESTMKKKTEVANKLRRFLADNKFKKHFLYSRLVNDIHAALDAAKFYRVQVRYITSAGNNLANKDICLHWNDINRIKNTPALLMGKGEYNKYLKEQEKDALDKKHHDYYEKVNKVIDFANNNRDGLIINGSVEQLDKLIARLFDGTVNSIKKVKTTESEEWIVIGELISFIDREVNKLVDHNHKLLDYYNSPEFAKIKETCETLMSTQREFNEYIMEKVESVSQLFGTKTVRRATVNEDEYNYIRPYKKTVTPFTAEVSSAVFASAENNPLEYIIKHFYPTKSLYPEQIRKLHLLIEELETLKDAKQIIENYKKDYQQYLSDVPGYIMAEDEDGFYSRLGFANIDESTLEVEYKFSYTSGGGMAQRTFTVPMTEDTIIELIHALESKLTAETFAKEQRRLMTKKLRDSIKIRDNFTCCSCGNSTHAEPNLLLEIDHIVPVAKGGPTEESNLQTLCWKCNRAKSDKILY